MNRSPAFYIWWKEVRGALPYIAATLACMWIPFFLGMFFMNVSESTWAGGAFAIGSTVIASTVFAGEFQDRTITWQFVLPIKRSNIVLRKLAVVAASQLAIFTSYLIVAYPASLDTESLGFTCGASIVVVSSVCLWASIFKNPLYTAVMTVAAPLLLLAFIGGFIEIVLPKLTGNRAAMQSAWDVGYGLLLVSFVVVGVIGFRRWLNLQIIDEQPTISELDNRTTATFCRDTTFRKRTVLVTLVRKELLVLRFVFWIVAIFAAISVIFVLADNVLFATNRDTPELFLRILPTVILFLFCVLTPLLIGAISFTEEKQIGNQSWNQTLPGGTRLQFAVKLAVSSIVNLFAGLVVPLLAVLMYASLRMNEIASPVLEPDMVLAFVSMNLVLFATAAWSSAVSDTSLKSILVAGLAITAASIFIAISQFDRDPEFRIDVFGLFATIAALAFCWVNFRHLKISFKAWAMQLVICIFAALITIQIFAFFL